MHSHSHRHRCECQRAGKHGGGGRCRADLYCKTIVILSLSCDSLAVRKSTLALSWSIVVNEPLRPKLWHGSRT